MAAVNVQQLKEAMTNFLNNREQAEFIEILNDFHSRRNISDFSHSLKNLLDTPAKRNLGNMVRTVLPANDAAVFDQIMGASYDTQSLPRMPRNGNGTLYRASSTPNVPAAYYQTVPSRGAKALRRSVPQNLHKLTQLPAFEGGNVGEIKTIHLDPPSSPAGLGFSIRGGAEHGIGIYVSYVDVDSVAERAGLVPGDQIMGVNGHSFLKASHSDAAKIIKAARKLELQIRNVGRVPGSFETHQGYTWVDPVGRTVSPPPEIDRVGRYDTRGERKSGLMLLKDSDERKVNVVVADQKMLGLMIRGGNEFGLGIYITGVDRGSVAENAGLKVGDHILDVNGQSFLDISHSEAVKVLKSSKHMMMTIKDIGKIPFARTTYDHTEWVTEKQLPKRPHSAKPTVNLPSNGHSTFTPLETSNTDSVFTRGAGSQLMHSAFNTQQATHGMVDEQARQLLNDNERGTLNYYLHEYQKGHVAADSLVLALCQLLNTPAKFSLMTEIRGLILPKDIDRFDAEVMEREVEAMKGTGDDISEQSLDTLSGNSQLSYSSNRDSIDADSDHVELSTPRPPPMSLPQVENGDDLDQLRVAINQISNQMKQEEEMRMMQQTVSAEPRAMLTRQHLNNRDQPRELVIAEVHPRPSSPKQYDDVRSPSEDSGVEMNGNSSAGTDSQSHAHSRVTVSQQEPIIINDVIHDGDISSQEDEVYFHKESAKVKHKVLRPHSRGMRSDLLRSELIRDRSPVYEEINGARVINGHGHGAVTRTSRDRSPGRRARSRSPGRGRAQLNGSPASFIDLNHHRDVSPSENGGFTVVVHDRTAESSHLRARSRSPRRPEPSPYRSAPVATGSYLTAQDPSPYRSGSPYRRDKSPAPNHIDTNDISALVRDLDIDQQNRRNVRYNGDASPSRSKSRERSPARHSSSSRDPSPHRRRQRQESPGRSRQRDPSPRARRNEDEIDGTAHRITVYKTKPTLGIAIEGGANTRQPMPRIINIQAGGSAYESGGVRVGQTILEVNGRSMHGLEHRQAAQVIARAFKDKSFNRMELVVMD